MRSASRLFTDLNFKTWQETYIIETRKSPSRPTTRIYVGQCKPFNQMNTPTSSSCPANSWAPSSAFYFLLPLALGCVSHPRGSIIFRRSSRAWRLSPFFLLIDNARIFYYFLQCLDSEGWRWRWGKVRVYAYAVLALREGNAWRQIEYDDFFEEEANERYLVSEENGDENGFASGATVLQGGEASEAAGDGEGAGDEIEPATSTLTRRTIGEMEEGQESEPFINTERSRVGDPARTSLEDWFTIGGLGWYGGRFEALTEEERIIAKRKVQQLLEARFRRNLEQVQDYEKGLTYRLVIWYPMVVQLAKATLVRGAPFTIALGIFYFLSFLLIEGCLFAARKPLDEDGRAKAMELLRSWGKLEAVPQVKYPGKRRRGVLLASASAEVWQDILIIIATIANASLCCWIFNFNPFIPLAKWVWQRLQYFTVIGKYFKGPWYTWPRAVVVTPFTFVFILWVESFNIFCYLLVLVLAGGLPFWMSMVATSWVQTYQECFSEVADMQRYRFGPAGTAIATGLLIFVAYFGLPWATGGLRYNCSTTEQIPFYNLLG